MVTVGWDISSLKVLTNSASELVCTSCCSAQPTPPSPFFCDVECSAIPSFIDVELSGFVSNCGCQDNPSVDFEWFDLDRLNGEYRLFAGKPGPVQMLTETDFSAVCTYAFSGSPCLSGDFGSLELYRSLDGTCTELANAIPMDLLGIKTRFNFSDALFPDEPYRVEIGIGSTDARLGLDRCSSVAAFLVFEGAADYASGESCGDISATFANKLNCTSSTGRISGGTFTIL